jgi:putative glycosyltransferase (TIGR04372 family)
MKFNAFRRNDYYDFVRRNYSAIYNKNWRIIHKTLLTSFFVLLNAGWAIPCVFIIRCLRPWQVIRLGSITSDHIGHFALEVSWLWSLKQQQTINSVDLFWFNLSSSPMNSWTASKPCNSYYAALTKRNFLVYPKFLLQPISTWNRIMPGGNIHHVPNSWERQPFTRDVHGWLQRSQVKMAFSEEENLQAKAWLRQQGWQDGDAFVCLQVRDSCYKGDKDYQSEITFRNSDINTYVGAVEWLASQGVWVLRMGKKMARPMPTSHPRIIDYAFHPSKSDFLDIWLFAHCDLCISTGSGPDFVSLSYNRPSLYLNYTPLAWFPSSCNLACAFKKLVWQISGISLSLLEYFDNCLHTDIAYSQKGIGIIDLTSAEILAAVQEQWHRLQGSWIDTAEDQDRHRQFWNILKSHPKYLDYHGWIHPESRASTVWLRSVEDVFFDVAPSTALLHKSIVK